MGVNVSSMIQMLVMLDGASYKPCFSDLSALWGMEGGRDKEDAPSCWHLATRSGFMNDFLGSRPGFHHKTATCILYCFSLRAAGLFITLRIKRG